MEDLLLASTRNCCKKLKFVLLSRDMITLLEIRLLLLWAYVVDCSHTLLHSPHFNYLVLIASKESMLIPTQGKVIHTLE
jgi:hypothetical protein